jgi:molybdopterin-containing oxidoreductase family iron-sulfur binding subunit
MGDHKKDEAAVTVQRKAYKGIEHAQQTEEYTQWVGDEFPHRKSIPDINRRDVLKLIGGTLALSGMATGCRFLPQRKIVPHVVQPEGQTPDEITWYATTTELAGYSTGVLAASYEGRPIKIEGNSKHPASLGGCSAMAMAETMSLYDPDRLQSPRMKNVPNTWDSFFSEAREAIRHAVRKKSRIVILTETSGSKVLADQIDKFEAAVAAIVAEIHPEDPPANPVQWVQFDSVAHDNELDGAAQAFGKEAHSYCDFAKAKTILSVDADLMQFGAAPVRYARDIMAGRDAESLGHDMNRIYAVDAYPTLTGAAADHREVIKPSDVTAFLMALASRVGVAGASAGRATVPSEFMDALVGDLTSHPGESVVSVGQQHSKEAHALVHAINEAIGAIGSTVIVTDPVLPNTSRSAAGADALKVFDGRGAATDACIFVLSGNPSYCLPIGNNFNQALTGSRISACLTSVENESCIWSDWALPASHFLEAWGDGTAYDGTASITQPLIEPMYDSRSAIEVLERLAGQNRTGEQIVRDYWTSNWQAAGSPGAEQGGVMKSGFDIWWSNILSAGVVPDTKAAEVSASVVPGLAGGIAVPAASSGIDLMILPDATVYDGRYSNNPWLQELPKPLTNYTWDNAIYVSPATADRFNLNRKELGGSPDVSRHIGGYGRPMAEVKVGIQAMTAPAAVNIGQADDTVVVHLGYGRWAAGEIGNENGEKQGGGFYANILRTATNQTIQLEGALRRTEGFYEMANVQFHNALESEVIDTGRDIVQEATLDEILAGGALGAAAHKSGHGDDDGHGEDDGHGGEGGLPNLYNREEHDQSAEYNQWAMTIDLNLCTGCNACTMACQSENNIPWVGKEQVQKGREMHWIRIDRYYMGDGDSLDTHNPDVRLQPVTCMHCEQAPCEPVCPVAATVHSKEGINQMVYNRCVGTRYCSNNCPYKVRRFNFLHYTLKTDEMPVLHLLQNPDVTVRGRGVMEKCTYCVQRINRARITAKKEGRALEDGDVVTACQSACPTNAIIFGDKRDHDNAVAKSRASRRNYALLDEVVNTTPRTTYLMKVTNPHPDLAGKGGVSHG